MRNVNNQNYYMKTLLSGLDFIDRGFAIVKSG
jgi:hypothetical protein